MPPSPPSPCLALPDQGRGPVTPQLGIWDETRAAAGPRVGLHTWVPGTAQVIDVPTGKGAAAGAGGTHSAGGRGRRSHSPHTARPASLGACARDQGEAPSGLTAHKHTGVAPCSETMLPDCEPNAGSPWCRRSPL